MSLRIDSRNSDSPTHKLILGCDTETYYESKEIKGLRSIQIYGEDEFGITYSRFFEHSTYQGPDLLIRYDICKQFFDWLESLEADAEIAFFNIAFDVSQLIAYLCRYSGYEFSYDNSRVWTLKKGQVAILESEMKMYSVDLRTFSGHYIHMIDIANFLPGSSLDGAAHDWIGKSKVKIESKRFRKQKAIGIERDYAMQDAKVTFELYKELKAQKVVEGHRTITIAGRTLRHFRDFLKDEYGLTFDEYFYPGLSKEEIEAAKAEFERLLRPSNRGGITMAVHSGLFENCRHIDARSMYPTQAVKPWIPIGPILHNEPEGPNFKVYFPIGFFKLKPGKIPYFQWRTKLHCARYHWLSAYEPGEYVKDCYLDGTYAIWEEEWEIIKESYEISDLDLSDVIYFQAVENVPLQAYMRMLYKGKNENVGSVKLFFKYLLNALYGKFLSRPDGTVIEYRDGQRVKVEETDRQTYYLPLGMWIAMGGRVQLYKAMSSIPSENVLYCDTDSIIFKGEEFPDVEIGRELGQWSMEAEGIAAWIVGPKTYQELSPDPSEPAPKGLVGSSCLTKCAGMPKDVARSLPFKELREGLRVDCFKPRRDPVTLAINIEPTTFEVSTRAQIFKSR